MEVKKVVEEWEIWDKEGEVTKSEEETKKLVQKDFTNGLKFLARSSQNGYLLQEKYGIML